MFHVCRCLEGIDLVLWSTASFRCPQHYCCSCSVSGDSAFMLQCTRCPVAYHVSCVPKEMHSFMHRLNRKAIVCPAHDNHSGKSIRDLLSGKGKAVPRKSAPEARVNADGKEAVFCVCRKAPRGQESWIACDVCDGWFHPKCVGLAPEDIPDIESYTCDACRSGCCLPAL
jgi:PHD-finger